MQLPQYVLCLFILVQGHIYGYCGCDNRHNGPRREGWMPSGGLSAQGYCLWQRRCLRSSSIGSERPLLSPCLYCQLCSGWLLSGCLLSNLIGLFCFMYCVEFSKFIIYDMSVFCFRSLMAEGTRTWEIERRMLMTRITSSLRSVSFTQSQFFTNNSVCL